jgi:hypothetical protein
MTRKRLSEDRFDPESDPATRQWASRLNLEPDEPIVIITAEIERLSTALQNEFKQVKTVVEGKQEGWLDTLTQSLKVIQLQQENQAGLRQNCEQLTSALEQLEQKLNELERPTAPSSTELTSFSADLAAWLPELNSLKASIDQLEQVSTHQNQQLNETLLTLSEDQVSLSETWNSNATHQELVRIKSELRDLTVSHRRLREDIENLPASEARPHNQYRPPTPLEREVKEMRSDIIDILQSLSPSRSIIPPKHGALRILLAKWFRGRRRDLAILLGLIGLMWLITASVNDGLHQGRAQVAARFGSEDQLEYWRQINQEYGSQIDECRHKKQRECALKLPTQPIDWSQTKLKLIRK